MMTRLLFCCLTLLGTITPLRPAEAQTTPGHRTVACFGVRGAIGYSRLEAWCFAKDFKRYHLVMHGLGLSGMLSSMGFLLRVEFPADRYDAQFDPIPGEYFASVKGFAPGSSRIEGSAGNKTVTARSINAGLGGDRTLAAHLRITRF